MDNQNCIFFMNTSGEMDTLQCLSEEELKSLLQNRESLEERSHFYKIQPEENQGKLIFLSGTPGSGKSSVALRLAQKEGFVYYEGDCFGNFTNPYIPLHVDEPSMAAVKQKPVKVTLPQKSNFIQIFSRFCFRMFSIFFRICSFQFHFFFSLGNVTKCYRISL